MNFLSSLDAKDRKLMLWCVGIAFALAVAIAVLMPNSSDNDNPLPSSYLAGQHGARAAYETLLRSGYPIERWERPLSELAATAGPETVVIIAQPYSREPEEIRAVRKIIERGGRVLACLSIIWIAKAVPFREGVESLAPALLRARASIEAAMIGDGDLASDGRLAPGCG